MTTQITVKANHGWPVKVTGINPVSNEGSPYGGIVPAGETRDFHCHSTMDLIIHEIQPGEEDFAPVPAMSGDDKTRPGDDQEGDSGIASKDEAFKR